MKREKYEDHVIQKNKNNKRGLNYDSYITSRR